MTILVQLRRSKMGSVVSAIPPNAAQIQKNPICSILHSFAHVAAIGSNSHLSGSNNRRIKKMDAKKIQHIRQRLSKEYENLIESNNRNRRAAEEITVENTEDEGDLATISHNRDLLYNLHEGSFARLRSIQQAMEALERGQYGECVRCGNDINEKRLVAVPWATLCIRCQEETEAEHSSSRWVLAGGMEEEEETEP
jgi:DnaK suppressor protein